ncbi:hypothetical protein B0H11DRAFT_1943383 [Mycena galericulata]|nr:hypothetical protein B0H11DRAFT_1943383 [Mycena galericulata]
MYLQGCQVRDKFADVRDGPEVVVRVHNGGCRAQSSLYDERREIGVVLPEITLTTARCTEQNHMISWVQAWATWPGRKTAAADVGIDEYALCGKLLMNSAMRWLKWTQGTTELDPTQIGQQGRGAQKNYPHEGAKRMGARTHERNQRTTRNRNQRTTRKKPQPKRCQEKKGGIPWRKGKGERN